MNAKQYLKNYREAKRRGDSEEASLLVYGMRRGARGVVSRFTQGKPILAYPVSWIVRLLECKRSKEALARVMTSYNCDEGKLKKRMIRRLKRDIYFSEFNYRIDADEYFRYHFENLSPAGRKSYVGSIELTEGFHKIADPEESKILSNKYNTYNYLKKYYKRDAILVRDDRDLNAFREFFSDNSRFFVKPLSRYGGQGVLCYNRNANDTAENAFKEFTKNGAVIVEQPIEQAEGMAKFHPQSINTVRIVTARMKDEVKIVQSSVRLGMGDSVVDNGCLSAAVDTEAGIIITPGRAAHGSGLHITHPDTGIRILGSEIPEWENALNLAYELMNCFKKQRIVGWDFAYSVNGWVVVEANSCPSIQILAGNGIGMRETFNRIVKQ